MDEEADEPEEERDVIVGPDGFGFNVNEIQGGEFAKLLGQVFARDFRPWTHTHAAADVTGLKYELRQPAAFQDTWNRYKENSAKLEEALEAEHISPIPVSPSTARLVEKKRELEVELLQELVDGLERDRQSAAARLKWVVIGWAVTAVTAVVSAVAAIIAVV